MTATVFGSTAVMCAQRLSYRPITLSCYRIVCPDICGLLYVVLNITYSIICQLSSDSVEAIDRARRYAECLYRSGGIRCGIGRIPRSD